MDFLVTGLFARYLLPRVPHGLRSKLATDTYRRRRSFSGIAYFPHTYTHTLGLDLEAGPRFREVRDTYFFILLLFFVCSFVHNLEIDA